jgi:hypothetical protein
MSMPGIVGDLITVPPKEKLLALPCGLPAFYHYIAKREYEEWLSQRALFPPGLLVLTVYPNGYILDKR